MCRIDIQKRGFDREINGNRGAPPKTRGGCIVYQTHLCRKGDYVKRFHERATIIEPMN